MPAMRARRFLAVVVVLAASVLASGLDASPKRFHRGGHRRFAPVHRSFISFGFGFGYPYYPYYGAPYYPYGYWAPSYYPGWVGVPVAPPNVGFVDLKVEPEEAEVWIGGEPIGIADDFDGFPDLLPLRPGRRTIVLKHPGYRDLRVRLDVVAGVEMHVRRRMIRASSTAP